MLIRPGTCPRCGAKLQARVTYLYTTWRLTGRDRAQLAPRTTTYDHVDVTCTEGHIVTDMVEITE